MLSCLRINICSVFSSAVAASFSPFQVSILLWGKLYFCVIQVSSFCNFFLCSLKYLASLFLFIIKFFLPVSSRLFINLYIVIKYPLSHLSFGVISCISFNVLLYFSSSKAGSILIAILCILSNFSACYFLSEEHIISAYLQYSSFDLIIEIIIFLIIFLSKC